MTPREPGEEKIETRGGRRVTPLRTDGPKQIRSLRRISVANRKALAAAALLDRLVNYARGMGFTQSEIREALERGAEAEER